MSKAKFSSQCYILFSQKVSTLGSHIWQWSVQKGPSVCPFGPHTYIKMKVECLFGAVYQLSCWCKRDPHLLQSHQLHSQWGGQSTPDSKKIVKNWEKEGKNWGKEGKLGKRKIRKKRQKSGRFFHFAPPDREGWLCYWKSCLVMDIISFVGGCRHNFR